MNFFLKIIICCIIVLSCKENIVKQPEVPKSDNSPIENSSINNPIESTPRRLQPVSKSDDSYTDCGYKDGTYSAEVDYDNPETGFTNTYELDVQVEDCNVIEIDFPKGGWLDSDHIDPTAIDNDGNASIDDDRGRTFDVHLSENDKKIKDEDDNNTDDDDNGQ
ncbi:MAG: hypothetical protein ABI261_08270 [Ginsengibacter sp.]